jgi:hypothetical protein
VRLGLPVPEPAIVRLKNGFGAAEPDPEIQDILQSSSGDNFGLAYVAGALGFDPAVDAVLVEPEQAAAVVWFDAYLTNPDRSARNTNLLVSDGRVWMIDHGSALFFHHRWAGWQDRIQSPFPQIEDHILLPKAGDLRAADARLRPRLDRAAIDGIVDELPADWLSDEAAVGDAPALRSAYATYLFERLNGPRTWLATAVEAQAREPRRLAPRETHRVV